MSDLILLSLVNDVETYFKTLSLIPLEKNRPNSIYKSFLPILVQKGKQFLQYRLEKRILPVEVFV